MENLKKNIVSFLRNSGTHTNRQTDREIRQFDQLGGEIHTHFAVQNIKVTFWLGGYVLKFMFDISRGSLIFLKNYEKYLIFVSVASYTLSSNM